MGFQSLFNRSKAEEQYNQLIEMIQTQFKDNPERVDALLRMYEDFKERVITAPVSGKLNFHNAFEGGYIDHILRVVQCAKYMKRLYEKMGGIIDFTDDELVFAAIHHDLGKLGTLEEPYYIPQESEWHRNKLLEVYKHNEDRQYMTPSDATFYTLQLYGVKMTQNEMIATKLTDGLYADENAKYLEQYHAGPFPMRCNLFSILHWADHMSAKVENDAVRFQMQEAS